MSGTVLLLRGVRHYDGPECYAAGRLRAGASLKLIAEPSNPDDSNAVVVQLAASGAKLGYISREIAPKYRDALVARRITKARIAKVIKGHRDRQDLRIYISLGMAFSPESAQESPQPELPVELTFILRELTTDGGVYEIRNCRNDRRYIGSSSSVRRRVRQHFTDAMLGRHQNPLLGKEFIAQGGAGFTARVLVTADTSSKLAAEEEIWIKRALQADRPLYNMTSDGQGRHRWKESREDVPPISDWLWQRRPKSRKSFRNPSTGEGYFGHTPLPEERFSEPPAAQAKPPQLSMALSPIDARAEFAARLRELSGGGRDRAKQQSKPPIAGEKSAPPNPPPTPLDARAEFAARLRKLSEADKDRSKRSALRRLFSWLRK